VLTEAALESRAPAAVAPLLTRLSELAAAPSDPEWTFASEMTQGEALDALGDPDADRHFAAALAYAESTGEPARIVAAATPYAVHAVRRADVARAEALVKQLDPYVALDFRAARAAALLHAMLGESAAADAASAAARRLAGERAPGELEAKAVAIRAGSPN
jgi:hypothetical protein